MKEQIFNFFAPCATTPKDVKLAKSALFWEITPLLSVIPLPAFRDNLPIPYSSLKNPRIDP
jgi:hypothetical protein